MMCAPVTVITGEQPSLSMSTAARLFAKYGYAIALIARGADILKVLSDETNTPAGLPPRSPSPRQPIRVALYNAGHGLCKPFLDISLEDVQAIAQANIEGAFASSKNVVTVFLDNEVYEDGATANVRGNIITSAFSARKHTFWALSQSLAKEFRKENRMKSSMGGTLTYLSRQRCNDPEAGTERSC
ncbi:hypothetical protein ARMGADRAFT_1170919 [Armillaria gallica]|uniref:NAD(P)-binding protein n=1 Tax=Armillaria gallica TaxID=47427 RepID=A0A2H3CME7_ARMGA|nr:hypothetical protein ARMGADRAFT_1170919 [Armillaria gallica]